MLEKAWYGEAGKGFHWSWLLKPVSWLFAALVTLRFRYYRNTQHNRWQPPAPVIVVGNITVGGSGKTPLLIALAEYLLEAGCNVGVVSRGYGGRSNRYPLVIDGNVPVEESGDEPAMIFRRLGCPVVVDPDRARAVKTLLQQFTCDIVLSDDGLQHYNMNRHFEIIVIDGSRGLGNGECLPSGPLREPPSRLSTANAVVINGKPNADDPVLMASEPLQMSHEPVAWVNVKTGQRYDLEEFKTSLPEGQAVHAVAGIGNPQRFFNSLQEMGFDAACHPFADHHAFSLADITFSDGAVVLMTEKDAVKCQSFATQSMYYLEISAGLPKELPAMLQQTLNLDKLQVPGSDVK